MRTSEVCEYSRTIKVRKIRGFGSFEILMSSGFTSITVLETQSSTLIFNLKKLNIKD